MSRNDGPLFLLEIGTEEIPDRMLAAGEADLVRELKAALEPLEILPAAVTWTSFSTPRRLAVLVGPLLPRQEDREELATGPAVKVAFDADGKPTKAAEGFARGQSVPVESLQRVETPKGEYLAVQKRVEGRPAAALLAAACPAVIRKLRFPKMMRWGDVGFRFVRPLRWLVALLDGEVVPFEVAGVDSGRTSRGHRSARRQEVSLDHAGMYAEALRAAGVLAAPADRRRAILEGLDRAAGEAGGRVLADAGLLEILVHMTEAPSVIHGDFLPSDLELPREVLVTAMRHHQRYFSVLPSDAGEEDDAALLPAFLAILNRPGDPDGLIRRGHEWVLRARLADARFFWEEDGRTDLEKRLPDLARVIFQKDLGSFHDKVERVQSLVGILAGLMGLPAAQREGAIRAARLSKCDLTTAMVGEFPELQGIMGGIYARRGGEPEAVAAAIYDQYRPAGAADALPRSPEGRLLALADRLDTLAGYFGLGAEPTGTRDPFALRRAALGVARILSESTWFLSLREAIDRALSAFPAPVRRSEDAARKLHEFLMERMRHVAELAGHRYDSVSAVSAVQDDDVHDAFRRLEALTALRADAGHEEAFRSLSSASKRIRNMLRDQEETELDPASLVEPSEVELHERLDEIEVRVAALLDSRDYLEAFRALASLRPSVDGFLGSSRSEGVLVMAEDPRLRDNRLALLRRAGGLFARIADFSEIVVEGN